jgi:hypothetical protein
MATTYFALDPFEAGDAAAHVGGAPGQSFLKKATPDVLAVAGAAIGIVRFDADEGEAVTLLTRKDGAISRTITGLAAQAGLVRISDEGRAEFVDAYAPGDYPLGSTVSSGSLSLDPRTVVVESTSGNALSIRGTPVSAVLVPEDGQVLGVVDGIYEPMDLPAPEEVEIPVTSVATTGDASGLVRTTGATPTDVLFATDPDVFGSILKCHGTNDQLAALQALIEAATAAWAIDGIRRTVRVSRGTLRVSAAPRMRSGVELVGAGPGLTVIKPHASWVPIVGDADRRENCLMYGEGNLDTATLDTTLSASIAQTGGHTGPYYATGNRKLGLTSLGSLAASIAAGLGYFVAGGHEPGDQFPPGPAGSSIRNCEILRAESLQTSPNRVTLKWPTKSNHTVANVSGEALYVKGVDPLRDFEIRGFTFDCSGGTHAVGLRLDRAMNGRVSNCTVRGFSRYGLEMFGCLEVDVDRLLLGGELNGGILQYACIDCAITGLRSNSNGLRYHANGIIRAGIQIEGQTCGTLIDDFRIVHMCSGIKAECHRGAQISNGIIDDMDHRPKQLRDGEEIVGIGLDLGAIDLTQASFSGPLNISNVQVKNCRCDPTTAGAGAELVTFSVWMHDTYNINCTGLSLINNGLSPYANVDGDAQFFMPGVGFQDCNGEITGLIVQGCEYAIGYRSSHGVNITGFEVHSSPYGGAPGPVIGLWFNQAIPTSVTIRNGRLQGGIYFGPQFVPDYNEIQLENIDFDGERFAGPLLLVKNTTGGTRTLGDVVVFDPAAAVGTREVDLAGADGAESPCIVAMSPINTIANNAPMFVAPANTYVEWVKVNGVVAVGNVLETKSGVVQAKVAGASPIPGRIIGKALTSKAGAGDGVVRVGPV